ncbi:MAG: 3-oxoacyl-[acyl-carrier-protein] reductase [Spirochaetes bacterium GWB1_48_6]|nr:MAG: 3-oxoacyl-[acyl-carrier-protein] reductase [Spirochaetes bacterium GWB1_48_6]
MLLKGKKAIVTGGSKGIGRSIVETFLKNGCTVYALSRSQGDDWDQVEALAKENGVEVFFRVADVADEKAIVSVVDTILKESGGIDIVVNNAGVTKDGLIFRLSSEDWNTVIQTNLSSAFYISKAVARHMIGRKGGSIINMTSIVGVHGNAGQSNYAASKAGLIGLTKSMALEVSSRGIRVNAVAPGFIHTEMTDKIPEIERNKMLETIPFKRMGTAKEIADVCLFLASDLSTYVTGQVLGVDGGMGV